MSPLLKKLLKKLPIPMWPDLAVKRPRKGQTIVPLRGWCQLDGHSCGYTAAFSVLEYFKPAQFPYRELRRHCDPDPDEGCGPQEIIKGLRAYGLKCRITRSLNKPAIDALVAQGSPIIIGVEGELLGYDDGHWMVIHGSGAGEVLLSNNIYPGRSAQWVSWSWLKPALEPQSWGLIVSK